MDKYKLTKISNHKIAKAKSNNIVNEVNSPLAKYDKSGNLSCIICRIPVKSAVAWKVHLNSRNHKQNVEVAKQLKHNFKVQIPTKSEPVKKPESLILLEKVEKNESKATGNNEELPSNENNKNTLPENFFDSVPSNKDASAPDEEEWKRFQKEIKEEYSTSNAIIAGDNETATIHRQLYEIDEQIQMWARVVGMENKKQIVGHREYKKENVDESTDEDSDSCDEYLDWRCKKFS